MRELKFRAWDGKRMFAPEFIDNKGTVYYWDPDASLLFDLEDAVLMQFTGLVDKSGKEIYEGDLLKQYDSEPLLRIEWDQWFCGYQLVWVSGTSIALNPTSCSKCEVVGNVHQNPELL